MTNEEIKKALVCCSSMGNTVDNCRQCPYDCYARCLKHMLGDTLKLIIEQEQEIKRLRKILTTG